MSLPHLPRAKITLRSNILICVSVSNYVEIVWGPFFEQTSKLSDVGQRFQVMDFSAHSVLRRHGQYLEYLYGGVPADIIWANFVKTICCCVFCSIFSWCFFNSHGFRRLDCQDLEHLHGGVQADIIWANFVKTILRRQCNVCGGLVARSPHLSMRILRLRMVICSRQSWSKTLFRRASGGV